MVEIITPHGAPSPEPEDSPPEPKRRLGRKIATAFLVLGIIGGITAVALGGGSKLAGNPAGAEAPDFTRDRVEDTEEITLSSFRGTVVVLNFWASWCGPCKEEAPTLAAGWKRWEGKGVQFLGVDAQDSKKWAREFQDEYGIKYPSAFDGDSRIKNRYGVTGFPETFFIDRDGIIVSKFVGPIDTATLDQRIAQALTERE